MRLLLKDPEVIKSLSSAFGCPEAVGQLAAKLKLCRPQIQRLSLLAQFVKRQLVNPEADPEREEIKDLRLVVKGMLYKELHLNARGRIQFDVYRLPTPNPKHDACVSVC